MDELISLPNIGRVLAENLHSIQVHTAEDLRALGAKDAFARIRSTVDEEACLHQLYALEGAIAGVRYTLLPDETIADLRAFFKALG